MLISYDDLIDKYKDFISYAFKNSDYFSLTFQTNKPYSNGYIDVYEEDWANDLKDKLLIQYVTGDKYVKQIAKQHVINIYHCSKHSRDVVLSKNNVFLINAESPEDLCFLRGNIIWFDSTTHEKEAIILKPTREDIEYLEKTCIRFYD